MGRCVNVAVGIAVFAVVFRVWFHHYLLFLPMGFIPWLLTGGTVPPWFHYEAYEPSEFASFTKPGDLIVDIAGKSGTNWMLYTAHMIRVKGNLDKYPYKEVLKTTPWLTCRFHPTQTWPEIKTLLNTHVDEDGDPLSLMWNHPDYPFRVFKSHETPIGSGGTGAVIDLKGNPKLKFIVGVRNTLDTLRSYLPFWGNIDDEWRKMHGGFPPLASPEQTFNDMMPEGVLRFLHWDFITAWWPHRHEPNVMFIHYDDCVKDYKTCVERIAKFADVQLTDAEVAKITRLGSFKQMQKDTPKAFDYSAWGRLDWKNGTGVMMKPASMLRSGKIGEGTAFFSDEQKARVKKASEEIFGPELNAWVQHGGSFK